MFVLVYLPGCTWRDSFGDELSNYAFIKRKIGGKWILPQKISYSSKNKEMSKTN